MINVESNRIVLQCAAAKKQI